MAIKTWWEYIELDNKKIERTLYPWIVGHEYMPDGSIVFHVEMRDEPDPKNLAC